MIYDPGTQTIVDNLGWVDKGSLWVYSVPESKVRNVAVEDSSYLGLKPGVGGLFRLVHHGSADIAVSIRHIGEPEVELASLRFDKGQPRFNGDEGLWSNVDASLLFHTGTGPRLCWIDASAGTVAELDLSWYNAEQYDLDYQGLVDCISFSRAGLVVVGVQRSSTLVLIDLASNQRTGTIGLADRNGNPGFSRLKGNQLMTSDYDSLCVVDVVTGVARCSQPVQPPSGPNARQFIGDFDPDGRMCAVARPFSGDAVQVDLETFEVRARAPVPGQPLAICMTSASAFVTRDWKSGRMESGRFPE